MLHSLGLIHKFLFVCFFTLFATVLIYNTELFLSAFIHSHLLCNLYMYTSVVGTKNAAPPLLAAPRKVCIFIEISKLDGLLHVKGEFTVTMMMKRPVFSLFLLVQD